MKLIIPGKNTTLAEWSAEQYLLVQKFVGQSNGLLLMPIGTASRMLALHEFQSALDNAEDELLEELVNREQIPERIQIFQAGMLLNIMRDKLLRCGLHHDTEVVWYLHEHDPEPDE